MGTSYESSLLRRLRVALEAPGSFAVDQTGTAANFDDVPFTEDTWSPSHDQEQLYPQTVQQTMDQYEKEVLGRKSTKVRFSTALAGSGILQDGSQAAAALPVPTGTGVKWWLAKMWAAIMGGYAQEAGGLGATTQVQAGTTTTTINVTGGHGVRFTAGRVIACTVNGRLELREVLSRSTDAISVKVAFSGIPSTSSTVYGGPTAYLTADPAYTLQLWAEGAHDYDRFWYGGLNGGFSLETKVGTAALPKLAFDLAGPLWTKMSNVALAAATYGNYSLATMGDFEMIVATVGSTTLTRQPISDASWAPAVTYQQITSGTVAGAVQSILRQRRIRKVPVWGGSFTPYWDNVFDYYAAQAARSNLAFFLQVGSATGGPCFLISAPTAQIEPVVQKATGGVAGQQVTFRCRNDLALGDNLGALLDSPLRIHMVG